MKPLEDTEYARLPYGDYIIPVDMLPEFIRRARQVTADWDCNISNATAVSSINIIPSEKTVAYNVANALTNPTKTKR